MPAGASTGSMAPAESGALTRTLWSPAESRPIRKRPSAPVRAHETSSSASPNAGGSSFGRAQSATPRTGCPAPSFTMPAIASSRGNRTSAPSLFGSKGPATVQPTGSGAPPTPRAP